MGQRPDRRGEPDVRPGHVHEADRPERLNGRRGLMTTDRAVPRSRTFAGLTIPAPGAYRIDPVHTFVDFDVRHLIVGRVRGRFDSFEGEFTVVDDTEQLIGDFEARFDAASIDTKVEMRDKDLRGGRFFDSTAFPTITLRGEGG